MSNHFPLWKNLLVIITLILAVIYAIPNLFGTDFAVQVSSATKNTIDSRLVKQIQLLLDKNKIDVKSIEQHKNNLLIRLHNSQSQLSAKALIKEKMGRQLHIALNLAPSVPSWLSVLSVKPMFLGLDLRGGVHFLLEIDIQSVLESAYERYQNQIQSAFRKKRLHRRISYKNNQINIIFKDNTTKQQGLTHIRDNFPDLIVAPQQTQTKINPLTVSFVYKKSALEELRKHAIKQNIITLRNRVNELGVSEPIIQQQGRHRIVIQLPGIQDTTRAKEILGAVATLEFRMVDEKNDVDISVRSGKTPLGSRLYRFKDGRPLLLKKRIIATGENIVNASSGFDSQNGGAMVSLSLDGAGGKAMLKTTQKYLHHRMAVVYIENKIESIYRNKKLIKKRTKTQDIINAATIQGVFSNRFQITGLDSPSEARNLALLLRAGSLAAPIEIIEERTIGPSLGQDNINQGFNSVMIGFILVLLFMIYRYRVFGVVANIALTVNLLMMIAVLSLLQATLTLPGIAGIVLTVGMAVDANVLIFERIREELRTGSKTQTAIAAGYEKAFSTITDANITTLIASVVLFSFGTGPIKGFAITLSIGILTSMFSAIVVSRAIVNQIYGDDINAKQQKVLSI